MATLILFNKPFKVMSQFTDKEGRDTLAKFINQKGLYPAGRLDYDSEGLMLLTDDGALQHQISHPKNKLPKTYWVQVEGQATDEAIRRLSNGVMLRDGKTRPAKVKIINEPKIWQRNPPIRDRKNKPTQWLEITITEGKNRQVRRMTAAVDLPTLRLIRHSIGQWQLGDLAPGDSQSLNLHMPKTSNKPSKQNSR
jgi:23S rRNA pseudouridine2457 synthase